MNILSLTASSPWRITVALDGTPPTSAAAYALAPADGTASDVTVASVWLVDANTAELALSAPLLPRLVYDLTISGTITGQVAHFPPVVQPAEVDPIDDPEARAYGVDLAWLSDAVDARRDIPRRRGLECVRYDLGAIVETDPGELLTYPASGAGLPSRVNGSATMNELAEVRARVRSQMQADRRVAAGGVAVTTRALASGELDVRADVKTVAVGESVQVSVRA